VKGSREWQLTKCESLCPVLVAERYWRVNQSSRHGHLSLYPFLRTLSGITSYRMAPTSERTPRVASISSAIAKAMKSASKSIPPPPPEHATPEGQSPSTDSLFRLIAQCPSCAKIDFASISRISSKTWGASTMAFTCTRIAECLPLPREELENYMRGNG